MPRWSCLCRMIAVVCVLAASLAAHGAADYPAVRRGMALHFPADTGAHPAYRTEWWYVTGWLTDGEGVARGFQVTFFRVRTGIGEDNPARLAPRQIILAHAAVADPAEGQLLHAERAARAVDRLAGAAPAQTHAWAGNWSIVLDGDHYRTRIEAEGFAFDLRLVPPGPPVLNGEGGFSQKAADPKHASHYYSRPRLAVSGTLRVRDRSHIVHGHAWLDHEWSSELMPPGAQGWDWIGINLHDGSTLMAFRMRDAQGSAQWAGATLVGTDGRVMTLRPGQVRFVPQRRWRSPRTGTEYPVEWEIDLDGRRLRVQPLMDDQELDSSRSTGTVYWEGAVRVFEGERESGRGYLEMTGYGERLRM